MGFITGMTSRKNPVLVSVWIKERSSITSPFLYDLTPETIQRTEGYCPSKKCGYGLSCFECFIVPAFYPSITSLI